MINLGVTGVTGKMGSAIAKLAHEDKCFKLCALTTKETNPKIGENCYGLDISSDLESLFANSDVVIDFTCEEALELHLKNALYHKKAIVIGTTGLSKELIKHLMHASKMIPIVCDTNMGFGIALMKMFVKKAAFVLREDFDVEILETHHRDKKDAPSGTAISLGKAVAEGRNNTFKVIYHTKKREHDEIGFAVRRGGNVVGEHTVSFFGKDEYFEITHKALSRDLFAKGALKAAAWIVNQKSGFYTMADILKEELYSGF
ncbi:MAG: 4-hydroxy-tetrahydrodipicolinate reductase [Alphaproteobacteria bacterium]